MEIKGCRSEKKLWVDALMLEEKEVDNMYVSSMDKPNSCPGLQRGGLTSSESSYTCNLVQNPESLSLSLPPSIYLLWVGGPNFCRISRKFGPSF